MAYVKNTWVDREGQTRYHETIDDDGALIFTPDYEKVTEMGTPVNADNMNHIEDGIEDHENRITVLEEGGDASNFLNKTQITNCLLEVPQNIKLELADGVLTLKAGSKVIVPNGVGVFEEFEVSKDVSRSDFGTLTGEYTFVLRLAHNRTHFVLGPNENAKIGSGTTNPTTTGLFYNTSLNLVRYFINGVEEDYECSFPICKVTFADGVITSINQVFNGMGYIGSTIWVDKGIKCLIPNGRNEDGSLNNIEHTTSKVGILNAGTSNAKFYAVIDTSKAEGVFLPSYSSIGKTRYYDSETNYWYINATNGTGGKKAQWCMLSGYICTGDNNIITSANFNKPFRAVDYNDLVKANVWIPDYRVLSSATAVGNYTIDLSTILPDDGYMYEVLVSYRAYYEGDSYSNGLIHVTNEYLAEWSDNLGYMTSAGDKYQEDAASCGVIPIGASRSFTLKIKVHGFTSMTLAMHSYRKLGKY